MFIIYKENTGRAELLSFSFLLVGCALHITSVFVYSLIRNTKRSLNFDLFSWSETIQNLAHTEAESNRRKTKNEGKTSMTEGEELKTEAMSRTRQQPEQTAGGGQRASERKDKPACSIRAETNPWQLGRWWGGGGGHCPSRGRRRGRKESTM